MSLCYAFAAMPATINSDFAITSSVPATMNSDFVICGASVPASDFVNAEIQTHK